MNSEASKRNSHATETSSLPVITLVVLLMTIVALLYIGYEYIADNTQGSEELTNVSLDTTSQNQVAQLPTEPELVSPMEIDTSSRNAPVDLSQAEPPVEDDIAPAETKKEENARLAESGETEKPKAEETAPKREEKPVEKKPEVAKAAVPAGGSSHTHTVRPGETVYSIASKYNMSVTTLKALNPDLENNAVKADVTKLKVKVRAVHTVGPGDVLRVVAEKYGVSKEALMKANGKTKDFAQRGERLIIPYPEKQ
ncbi:LysM peptidoglycan-binding domain-containing protein [Tellurirhabdus rosea]|uniref:LysM peptidoglycan-binding domain-containing protein n=1 Tax=Tellurirhabdus rosea TaxID=2674997 RepID=UPI00224E6AD3|nr:LysM peptidoglycan-binding domain-containing protein [Tellurirhabdus rosea]